MIVRFLFHLISVFFLFYLTGCTRQEPTKLNEALVLYNENKLDEALPLFEQLVTRDKANAEYHSWLAETYRRLGRKAEAMTSARTALGLDPATASPTRFWPRHPILPREPGMGRIRIQPGPTL